jgi:1-phosphofructokinase family hexose kinase
VLIATPNLCLDRTQFIAELVPGAVLRPTEVEVTAGGKGVNIARVVRAHGGSPRLVGLVAEEDRHRLLGLLRTEEIEVVEIPVAGSVRMASIMIEQDRGRITVVNEPGATITQRTWDAYRDAVAASLPGQDMLICSGSIPPGAPVDAYAQLVELAHKEGLLALVDAGPAALRAALEVAPDLVTPNLQEAEAAIRGASGAVLVDAHDNVRGRATAAARTLCDLGARAAAVTVGGDGVALARQGHDGVRWLRTVPVTVVSAVGAGDSFLAGVALAVQEAGADRPVDWERAVVRGLATATASCEQLRAGGVDPARVAELAAIIATEAAEAAETAETADDAIAGDAA